MRLSKIKLAGFKSFVDPVTINFPSKLTGIVGPNGCGKSNTIDAVRWVMGESSAKHLRGDSMDDVIFNGSSTRKPVGQASVELVFDNSDARLGGEYAAFSEIALRRQVSRDGTSKYFLNGSRCRRRDITDIFLGTGLGPRSYAIIEQGMISRLIEAKPQELRVTIEEAAGISKYKQRRKETETRIRHTRENLERLDDLRDEIEKQINRLNRQSKTAEKYKRFKQEERQLKAEVLVLKLHGLSGDLEQKKAALNNEQTSIDKQIAELRQIESDIEKLRVLRTEQTDAFNLAQETWYKTGAEISRIEQQIQHQKELQQRQRQDQEQNRQAIQESEAHIVMDEGILEDAEKKLLEIQPRYDVLQAKLDSAKQTLQDEEAGNIAWGQEWEQFNKLAADYTQKASVERSRMDQLERHLKHLEEREGKLLTEQNSMSVEEISDELSLFSAQVRDVQSDLQSVQGVLNSTVENITGLREKERELRANLDQQQTGVQDTKSEIATLNALQAAALGIDKGKEQQWLDSQGLAGAARLGECLESEKGWEQAVELVMGDTIEAIEVDSIGTRVNQLAELENGRVIFFEKSVAAEKSQSNSEIETERSLWSAVKAPESARDFLQNVLLADTLDAAMKMRSGLQPQQSVITPQGVWIGRGWVRVTRGKNERAGLLQRKKQLEFLQTDLQNKETLLNQVREEYTQTRETIRSQEEARLSQQDGVNKAHRLFAERNALLSNRQSRHEQVEKRQQSIVSEISEIKQQQEKETTELEAATHARNEALDELEKLAGRRAELEHQKEIVRSKLQDAKVAVEQASEDWHRLEVEKQSTQNAFDSSTKSLQRLVTQLDHLRGRQTALLQAVNLDEKPDVKLALQLEQILGSRVDDEKNLDLARSSLEGTETNLTTKETERSDCETKVGQMREQLESIRMAQQESKVRHQTLIEQLEETGFAIEELEKDLPEDAGISAWEENLENMGRKIERLGPINLAAIDEFKEQSERKEYLDNQHKDLTEALDTLEKAIGKIDKETRSRFKDTFDKVNNRIQETFPKLFGGGSAHLELTEDDLLTSGVVIMAKPPGKRIANIHLLSGGEKALTAVSLVFAIFELNPAPFCMLDEVDAPLDEANVGRYCKLVKEMSEHVQFIFITHNKTSMEMAEQLMGVTMREAGVSRLVDVNVDEASIMATG